MTMLASWVGVDSHGVSSAYIISDSRFSWSYGGKILSQFDHGRKVFASSKYPEIFGYAGDVLFPTVVISQIIDMIDGELLFEKTTSCEEKSELIFRVLKSELTEFPSRQLSGDSIQIIYITHDTIPHRINDIYPYAVFYAYKYIWDRKTGWSKLSQAMPLCSGLLYVIGSGKKTLEKNYYDRYQRDESNNQNTSRNVYHCFVDTLNNINDQTVGGAPQLVGIYRKPGVGAKHFGVVYKDKRYILGVEIEGKINYNRIEWRNEFFERTDGDSTQLLDGAMRQPDTLRKS